MKTEDTYQKESNTANVKTPKLNDEFSEIYGKGITDEILNPSSTGSMEEIENGIEAEETEVITEKGKEFLNETDEKERDECNKCYNEDTPETKKKKREAIEKFYKDANKVNQAASILRGLLKELFTGIEIDENPEDEMQNIAESFLTKRKWNVEKKPDYGKQLLYVIRYNLIPNLLTKYYGRKIRDMSDEEMQMRNYYGTGNREKPFEKNTFTREILPEFEINESEGMIAYGKEDMEGVHRIERASYETRKESKKRLSRLEGVRKRIESIDRMIKKHGDNEVKMLWEILKNAEDQVKTNIKAGKIMNKTQEEMKVIKRRFLRAVSK